MRERSAPMVVRSWVVVASLWGLTMTTPPGNVGQPSGSGEPEETQAAIWRARRLLRTGVVAIEDGETCQGKAFLRVANSRIEDWLRLGRFGGWQREWLLRRG